MKSVQVHNGFFLTFERGEEVMSSMQLFGERENIDWAVFNAIGSVEDIVIGYYDMNTKQYVFSEEQGPFELLSLKGNISEMDQTPIVHAHAALARCDETLAVIGGHVRSMRVAVTLEMILWLVTQPLTRAFDDDTGLNLIQL